MKRLFIKGFRSTITSYRSWLCAATAVAIAAGIVEAIVLQSQPAAEAIQAKCAPTVDPITNVQPISGKWGQWIKVPGLDAEVFRADVPLSDGTVVHVDMFDGRQGGLAAKQAGLEAIPGPPIPDDAERVVDAYLVNPTGGPVARNDPMTPLVKTPEQFQEAQGGPNAEPTCDFLPATNRYGEKKWVSGAARVIDPVDGVVAPSVAGDGPVPVIDTNQMAIDPSPPPPTEALTLG